MEKNNYMTPQCHQRLNQELEHLTKVERPEITKVVQWAAGNGDRSENADYIYGKKRMREIDRRIRFLLTRLAAAVVVDPCSIKSDKVQFGATVVVKDEQEKMRTYAIVGVDEVDTQQGHISWQSPIGRNLMGKKVGDDVTIQIPLGELNLEIISITYQELALPMKPAFLADLEDEDET
jgi:transcription elongation factor GreB